jgi:TagF N-terminal domain, Type VI secretion system-associated
VPVLRVSCFGKLPFHREFLRAGLGSAAASWVVRWIEGAHESWSRAGDAPAESSTIRFAAALEGGGLVAGVARQSSDGLRRHPVTFFVEDERDPPGEEWHLAPLALAPSWDALCALSEQPWDSVASLTADLAAGAPEPVWDAARAAYRDALATPLLASPWEALVGATGDPARHTAANLLSVLEAQRAARSATEGVSVAVPLQAARGLGGPDASFWVDVLQGAAPAARPVICIGPAPPRLVVFFRPPEGPDLAAVLSSLEMAPIDDLGEPWQALPAAGSDRARAIDALVASGPASLGELRGRIRSTAAR